MPSGESRDQSRCQARRSWRSSSMAPCASAPPGLCSVQQLRRWQKQYPGSLRAALPGAVTAGGMAEGGYLFSMNDLEGLAYLPALQEAGVAAVKIEGRLKNAAYVSLVTRAYRLVLDALAVAGPRRERELATAMEEGRELLGRALGRRTATGFLSLPPRELVSPASSGNIGDFLGRIERCRGRWATLSSSRLVGKGDPAAPAPGGRVERLAFSVKEVRPAAAGKQSAAPAAGIEAAWRGDILLPAPAAAGDSLYLVDTAANRRGERRQLVVKQHHQRRAGEVSTGKVARRLAADGWQPRPARQESAVAGGKAGKPKPPLPLWLKVDDPALLKQRLPAQVERIVLPLTPESRECISLGEIPRPLRGRLIWALPPVILEEELPFYRREIAALRQRGFQAWQLGHLSQLQFFIEQPGETTTGAEAGAAYRSPKSKGRGGRARRPPELELYGDYTLNILNSLALDNCRAAGLRLAQAGIDGDRANLRHLGQARPDLCGLTIYGRPPLFTARLDTVHFRQGVPLLSPRQEEFELRREGNRTLVLAAQPFSLLPYSAELAAAGVAFGVVDLCRQRLAKRDLLPLLRQAGKKAARSPTLSNFNYLHGLE
ncbi:MAG: U32 family peptidase [Desulfurivibrio sp.]|nr:U32 family peptidase [Desulfurivibrio sp.]